MGKSKRKKSVSADTNTANPIGLPSMKEALEEAESNGCSSDDFVLAHIDKLSSTMAEERECACIALSGSSTSPALLAKDTVRLLGMLLLDCSVNVVRSASGLLRNMSVDGGYSACDIMIGHDVMTPLLALLRKFSSEEWKVSKPVDGKVDAYTETLVNAIQLLQSLCETSNIALKVASLESVAEFLVQRLDPVTFGGAVSVSAAECLLVLTEDNAALRACLQAADPALCLVKAATGGLELIESASVDAGTLVAPIEDMLHAVVAIAGVLVNLSSRNIGSLGAGIAPRLLNVLLQVIEIDSVSHIQQLYETACCNVPSQHVPNEAVLPSDLTLGLHENRTRHLLIAQKLALEILTDILSTDGSSSVGDDDWEDVEDAAGDGGDLVGMEDSDQLADGLDAGAELEAAEGPLSAAAPCMPSELLTFLLQNGLLQKVSARIRILPDELLTKLAECETLDGAQVIKRYDVTVCAALLCLHNAALAAATAEQLGGADAVCGIWTELSHLSSLTYVLDNAGLVESVTTALGSVAEHMVEGAASEKLLMVTDHDLSMLGVLAASSIQPQVRANAVHIVSVIGQKLAAQPPSASLASSRSLLLGIGRLLLQVASCDSELWVTAEALDALLDVFAEDHVDSILKELRLIDTLEQMAPVLKAKIKQNRQLMVEHLPVIMTVQNNLGRFITYKRKRGV